MNKKCILILPYFGCFNNYFDLFLKSCKYNEMFDWLIITDCKKKYILPDNVRVQHMSLGDLRERVEKKLGFKVCLNAPYKLCDYKPAYGLIFEELISEYDYWGHCDCDLIFGNMGKLLVPLLEKGYDKIFAAGHLTIYKNSKENRLRFMSEYHGDLIYKEAFTTDEIFVFDEDCKYKRNIHSIFLENNAKVYAKDLSMNASTESGKLIRVYYDENDREWKKEPWKESRFYWNNGELIRITYDQNKGELEKEEYLYLHLQMRKMALRPQLMNSEIIEILPDRFVARKKIPENKKEMNLRTISWTYGYHFNLFARKINKRMRNMLHRRKAK